MKAKGGKAVYGASGGILMLDAQFPRIPGDMGNATTWPFPVHYKIVRGATPDLVVRQSAPGLLEHFVDAAREVVADGVDGSTTNCGFLSLMQAELQALDAALGQPERPVVALVGGAKVSTKLDLLGNLVEKVDHLVIGGGMANTFLAAQGVGIGKSLAELDLAQTAKDILAKAAEAGCDIHLPTDFVVAREFKAGAAHETVAAGACPEDAMILDAGPETVANIGEVFSAAKTLIWNGPLGAFEIPPFDAATLAAAEAAATLTQMGKLKSVAGGGDTVSALNTAGASDRFSYISTAGGAFLEWMEGKTLPGVAALSNG